MSDSVKILLVDYSENKTLLKEILANEAYKFIETKSLNEGYNLVKIDPSIGVVVARLDEAKSNSSKFLNAVKKLRPDIPTIIMTPATGLNAMRLCAEVGGDDFVTIPFDDAKAASVFVRVTGDLMKNESRGIGEDRHQIAGYEMLRVLGRGAMGTVYLGRQDADDDTDQFAIKILNPMPGLEERHRREALERFLREAELVLKMDHPNIVTIVDYGLEEDQLLPYIVMEYVEGEALYMTIKNQTPLSIPQKLDIIKQIVTGLQEIHFHGISHRDLKPENILLDKNLNAKILDFGFARMPNSELTQTVKLIGTPFYMAPEAYASALVDFRADIFAFGVIVYEFLTGIKPFLAESMSDLRRVISTVEPAEPRLINPDIPEELQKIIFRCIEKDPNRRYQTTAEIIDALESLKL